MIPAAGGKPRAFPLGELEIHGEPAWMPDGQSILVSAAPPPDAANVLQGGEIYAVRLSDGTRRQITHHPGPDEEPVPSPDGSRIAWIAREPKPQSYVVSKLYVANPDGSRAKVLAGSLDRDVRHPQWSSDSRTVYFLADDHGATYVYAARNDGSVRQVTNAPDRLSDFSVADTGRAVTVRAPGELITFPVDLPATPVMLAAPNQQLAGGARTRRDGSDSIPVRRQDDPGLDRQTAGLRRRQQVSAAASISMTLRGACAAPSFAGARNCSRPAVSWCSAPIRAALPGTARSSAT